MHKDSKSKLLLPSLIDKGKAQLKLTDDETDLVPEEYKCPFTFEIMKDPVMTVLGQTYDRKSIENWFKQRRENNLPITDPNTNKKLGSEMLIPNFSLKKMIQEHPMLKQEHANNHRLFNNMIQRKNFARSILSFIYRIKTF